MVFNKFIWDRKIRVANIKGTNFKPLNAAGVLLTNIISAS